jgi:hypothetical protein
MIIATVSAVLGVLMMFAAMLQGITFTMRYAAIVVLIVSEAVFVWSFLSLGTQN